MKTRLKLLAALLALAATATAADLTTIIESIDLTPTGTWDFTGGQITVNDADLPATASSPPTPPSHRPTASAHSARRSWTMPPPPTPAPLSDLPRR